MSRAAIAVCMIACAVSCGPAPRPADAYDTASDLLRDVESLRGRVRSFRITGRADHFGTRGRIQGRVYLFGERPGRLRVDLVSPMGGTLAVLTVNGSSFRLADLREGRYYEGPAEPCNVARLLGVALAPEDVLLALVGHVALLPGEERIEWDGGGFYRVEIHDADTWQRLEIGPSRDTLPLRKAVLGRGAETIAETIFDRWRPAGGISVPREIRVRMPRDRTELLVRYDDEGVEFNVDLPEDSWNQTWPTDVVAERVECDSPVGGVPVGGVDTGTGRR